MKKTFFLLTILFCFTLSAKERSILDFGANGNDRLSDNQAFKKAVAQGPGVVVIPAGTYYLSNVTIPSKVTVRGHGKGTIIKGSGKGSIFVQNKTRDWRLEKLVLEGKGKGDVDNKEQGLFITLSKGFAVQDVETRNFNGKSVEILKADFRGYVDAGSFVRVYAHHNYIGISFSDRAEYMTVSQVKCSMNRIGLVVRGGNMAIGDSHFNNNHTGVLLEDGPNGSHGSFSNCLINHNTKYSIIAKNVKVGHIFTGCSVFFGPMLMENAWGIVFNAGNIAVPIEVKGAKSRIQFTNNFIHSARTRFSGDKEKVHFLNNFDGSGPWPKSR